MEITRYPSKDQLKKLLLRPEVESEGLQDVVHEVFEQVQDRGDAALIGFTSRFDKVEIENLRVSEEEIELAKGKIDTALSQAIEVAKHNIEKFHQAQVSELEVIETTAGVECWRKNTGIDSVGLYIPGGSAPLFSTVLMLGIPAKIAGCEKVVLCSPPNREGSIHPAILFAADLVGIKDIYKVGGIQAIAAMTLGTESIPAAHKLFGPGNQYVMAAKLFAQNYNIAIDMPAGPSEVMVVADSYAEPAFVAADLLAQAEHGADSQVVLVTTDEEIINPVLKEIDKQCELLPRKDIAKKALENSSIILVENNVEAVDIINEYAPEHLIVAAVEEGFFLQKVRNAGSVFLGNFTPESAGDYASGTNHTLPTNGFAKNYSGVSIDSFVKKITYQRISKNGIRNLGPAIELMASAEELVGHKNAVSVRLNKLNEDV